MNKRLQQKVTYRECYKWFMRVMFYSGLSNKIKIVIKHRIKTKSRF